MRCEMLPFDLNQKVPEELDLEYSEILAETGCPFCRLFLTEVGILNGSERDLVFRYICGKLMGISLEENDFLGRLLQKDLCKF
jgi:hypothetical protein